MRPFNSYLIPAIPVTPPSPAIPKWESHLGIMGLNGAY